MDNGYAGSDPAILRANLGPPFSSTTPPYLDNLVSLARQPLSSMAGSNFPLGGLYEAATSRMKGDGMVGILAKSAAHLYRKTPPSKPYGEFPQSSPLQSACDLRVNLQQQMVSTSCADPFETMDVITTPCNANTHLNSPNYLMLSSSYMNSHMMLQEKETFRASHEAENNIVSPMSPTSFSEIMLHAMEISGENNTMPVLGENSSLRREAMTQDPKSALATGVSSANLISRSLAGRLAMNSDSLLCPNSPSKQDSSVMTAEDSDGERKALSINLTKKRCCGHKKAQQKKIVYVPFCENKQKGEAPHSDTWAWRKYGQKPIKGSPFPRCSSSKGCPARKQVERSRNNPSMVMVTYTAAHNHPWPLNNKLCRAENQEEAHAMERPPSSVQHNADNLFPSVLNSPKKATKEQVAFSMDCLEDDRESVLLQRDVDLCLSRTSTEGDDVFDNLGELPELSAIFNSKGLYVEEYFEESRFEQSKLL